MSKTMNIGTVNEPVQMNINDNLDVNKKISLGNIDNNVYIENNIGGNVNNFNIKSIGNANSYRNINIEVKDDIKNGGSINLKSSNKINLIGTVAINNAMCGTDSVLSLTKLYGSDKYTENPEDPQFRDGAYTVDATCAKFQKREWENASTIEIGGYYWEYPMEGLLKNNNAEICIIATPSYSQHSEWRQYSSIINVPLTFLTSSFVQNYGIAFSGELYGVKWSGIIKYNSTNNSIYYSYCSFNNEVRTKDDGDSFLQVYIR